MRELRIPDGVAEDDNATEMIRFWLANGRPNLSLYLGMYENDERRDIDELFAWGNFLSDIAQHVAHGLEQSHGRDFTETVRRIAKHFQEAMKQRAPGLEGGFPA